MVPDSEKEEERAEEEEEQEEGEKESFQELENELGVVTAKRKASLG